MAIPVYSQSKADMQHHMSILQRRLAERTRERDAATARIDAAEMRTETAERSARDIARDRDVWRQRAIKAETALKAAGIMQ